MTPSHTHTTFTIEEEPLTSYYVYFLLLLFLKKRILKAASFSINLELLKSYLFNFIAFTKLHLVTKGQRHGSS